MRLVELNYATNRIVHHDYSLFHIISAYMNKKERYDANHQVFRKNVILRAKSLGIL